MPLYLALLFKVMKAEGTHEGCIEQVYGLLKDSLYGAEPYKDDEGRLRADRFELADHVQAEVESLWQQVDSDNLMTISDFAGYQREFMQLFGFELDGVDYQADVDTLVPIAGCE